MRCAILELEATLETFPVWFIFGGRLPQTRGVFSTVLLKSVAVCLYAFRISRRLRAHYPGWSRIVDLGLDATCYRAVERLTYLQNMAACHFDLRLQKIIRTQSQYVQH